MKETVIRHFKMSVSVHVSTSFTLTVVLRSSSATVGGMDKFCRNCCTSSGSKRMSLTVKSMEGINSLLLTSYKTSLQLLAPKNDAKIKRVDQ